MISVIIPTYKPDLYFNDCIKSIINQNLSRDLFEVIIILNGDKFPYYSEIELQIKDFSNFHLLYTSKKGVSNARNIGIEASKGKYICFVDDDDIISENYLKSLLFNINDRTNCLVVSNVYSFTDNISNLEFDYITNAFFASNKDSLFSRRQFLSTSCCKIIPRKMIGNARFNTKFERDEDALFMFSISKDIENIEKSSKDTIYYRRLRPGSASRSRKSILWRVKHALSLMRSYSSIYLNKNYTYETKLFLSRIVATIVHL